MNYQKIYDQIITRAKKEVLDGVRSKRKRTHSDFIYYEAHHIIPRCLGGSGEVWQWRWHENIVLLTAKEHYICHMLLAEIYPEDHSIWTAFWFFCNGGGVKNKKYNVSSITYERHRLKRSKIKTPDHIIAILKEVNIGKKYVRSKEYKKNVSNSKKGDKNPAYGKPSHRAIVILKFDKEMNLLEEFPNSYKAAESVKGQATKIIACCKNKRPYHMNYIWRYKDL